MTWSTIMHENIAVMDSHVELKLALQQINIFFTIHGGSRWQKMKSSCPPEGHRSPYFLTRGMFHCWGSALFLVPCSNRPTNPISSNRKLLYSRFVRKKYLLPHIYVLASMSLGEINTFFLHRPSQALFSGWLARFVAKNERKPALNSFGTDYCASFH